MAEIKNIEVKMTFTVGLGNYDATAEQIKQLREAFENSTIIRDGHEDKYPEAISWLNTYIDSSDAYKWEYEIEDFEE